MKYFIFDMDGVLLDSERVFLSSLQRFLRTQGHSVTHDDLLPFVGLTSLLTAEKMRKDYNLPGTSEDIRKAMSILHRNFYWDTEMALLDGADTLLRVLRERGTKIALASSTSSTGILTALNRFRLIPYFDAIVSRDLVEKPKPDPDCYLLAASLLGASPGNCVVVEDSRYGIAAAKAAGMYVIAYKGASISQDTARADIEVLTHQEIIDHLDLY